jgi:hypothetical protein
VNGTDLAVGIGINVGATSVDLGAEINVAVAIGTCLETVVDSDLIFDAV